MARVYWHIKAGARHLQLQLGLPLPVQQPAVARRLPAAVAMRIDQGHSGDVHRMA